MYRWIDAGNIIKGDGITQCFIRAYDGEGKWDEYIANET